MNKLQQSERILMKTKTLNKCRIYICLALAPKLRYFDSFFGSGGSPKILVGGRPTFKKSSALKYSKSGLFKPIPTHVHHQMSTNYYQLAI